MNNELKSIKSDHASFRDPAATVFSDGKTVLRAIYPAYFPEYDLFMDKVYPDLIERGLIIPHVEMERCADHIVIKPDVIPFISYPYEWSFSRLKEAALVTLMVNQVALSHGMMLKDASAYNVQYYNGRMVFIDTTSFMFYSGDTPWPAYAQYLRHFICPMLWIKHYSATYGRLSEIYLDGLSVAMTAKMLPLSRRFSARHWSHIFSQSWADIIKDRKRKAPKMPRIALDAFLMDLQKFTNQLHYKPVLDHGWLNYSEAGSYTPMSLNDKHRIINEMFRDVSGTTVLDLGANTGHYSRIAAGQGNDVIAVDSDHDCIMEMDRDPRILGLVMDLCNPSPGIGWANQERAAFWDRIGKVDTILALALVHHLCIRNNVPLRLVAQKLAKHCNRLIIEWIPLEDKQAQRLLGTKNIPEYHLALFLEEFSRHFNIHESIKINGSGRKIYRMEKG
jgi:hypothetical protein